jgi:hypothetical protein
MHNLAPRGIRGTCVPTSIRFVTGADYIDIEDVLVREQPGNYKPDIKGNLGVDSRKLLGESRVLFGFKFTKVCLSWPNMSIQKAAMIYSTGTYLVIVPKHMLVIKDGAVYDLADTNTTRVPILGMWKVEKN